jgi:hypothetical protein
MVKRSQCVTGLGHSQRDTKVKSKQRPHRYKFQDWDRNRNDEWLKRKFVKNVSNPKFLNWIGRGGIKIVWPNKIWRSVKKFPLLTVDVINTANKTKHNSPIIVRAFIAAVTFLREFLPSKVKVMHTVTHRTIRKIYQSCRWHVPRCHDIHTMLPKIWAWHSHFGDLVVSPTHTKKLKIFLESIRRRITFAKIV